MSHRGGRWQAARDWPLGLVGRAEGFADAVGFADALGVADVEGFVDVVAAGAGSATGSPCDDTDGLERLGDGGSVSGSSATASPFA